MECDYLGKTDPKICNAYKDGICLDKESCGGNTEAKNLLREIAGCGITDSDPELKRISWIEVQVERELWERIQEAVK